jgi:hypothetical protein
MAAQSDFHQKTAGFVVIAPNPKPDMGAQL